MKARLIYAVALQHPNLMERVQQTPNFPGNIVEIYETREEAVKAFLSETAADDASKFEEVMMLLDTPFSDDENTVYVFPSFYFDGAAITLSAIKIDA
jgi:hypothetical protein